MTDNLTDRAHVHPAAASKACGSTVRELLAHGQARLAGGFPADQRSARLDAELLLAAGAGLPRSTFIAWPEREVAPSAVQVYLGLLTRAEHGEPLAYLTGQREFWSLPLVVEPAVLIPRPETELAVERCLALGEGVGGERPFRVCDLGTGSGAIALALAVERPEWSISATDRSSEALRVARSNAERLGVRQVEFLQSDWFQALGGRRFDLIVSNPPYIAAADPALARLRYEPRDALTPGSSGLEALEAIITQAPAHLRPGAALVLEHGADQAAEVARILLATRYACVRCWRDLAGRERTTEARWAGHQRN